MLEKGFLVINDDCLDAMRKLIDEGVQVDSIVTDPPYEINFMNKDFDKTGIAHSVELWKLCLQILKPGGHLLAFGATRTYHRMACAIEDAGFEIRDCIRYMGQLHYPAWVQGQGFPKSTDVSKQIDKMAGAEREIIGKSQWYGRNPNGRNSQGDNRLYGIDSRTNDESHVLTSPATDAAKQWQGFGSALKPSWEPVVLARRTLSEKTIAENVLKHGTGGLNIDGCRVEADWENDPNKRGFGYGFNKTGYQVDRNVPISSEKRTGWEPNQGRFPSNLIHDGSEEVEAEFLKFGIKESHAGTFRKDRIAKGNCYSPRNQKSGVVCASVSEKGSASRFFYAAKASKRDRNGSKHPTVKPIALMRYLCRLITQPGGTILDPFAGSGTTGQAAIEEGFKPILIEKEKEYVEDILKRISIMEENQDGANVTIHVPDKVSEAVNLHKEHSTQNNIPNNGGEIQAEKVPVTNDMREYYENPGKFIYHSPSPTSEEEPASNDNDDE